jgi:hypothetical protein
MVKTSTNKPDGQKTLFSFFKVTPSKSKEKKEVPMTTGEKTVVVTPGGKTSQPVVTTPPMVDTSVDRVCDNIVEGEIQQQEPVRSSPRKHQNRSPSRARQSAAKYPIGTIVQKLFEGEGLFEGKVVAYEDSLYSVEYDDGDVEDYSESELTGIVFEKGKTKKAKTPETKGRDASGSKRRILDDDDSSDEEFQFEESGETAESEVMGGSTEEEELEEPPPKKKKAESQEVEKMLSKTENPSIRTSIEKVNGKRKDAEKIPEKQSENAKAPAKKKDNGWG